MADDYRTFDKNPVNPELDLKHAMILGGTGFIGRHLAKELLDTGWKVTLLHQSSIEPLRGKNITYVRGDRSGPESLKRALIEPWYDLTIDLIGHTEPLAEIIVQTLFGHTAHHIHLSSENVYRTVTGIAKPWREENLAAEPDNNYIVNSTVKTDGRENRMAEDYLIAAHKKTGFPLTIVRPSHVSGPYDKTNFDYTHILRLQEGREIIIPVNTGMFRHIQVSDLVKIIRKIAEAPRKTIGHQYNAAGGSLLSLREYLELLAYLLEKPFKPVELDSSEIPGDIFYPFCYSSDHIPDITRIEKDLNFTPRGMERFLGDVISWYTEEFKGEPPEIYTRLRDWELGIL